MDNLIKLLRDAAAAYRKSVYDPDPEKVDVMFTLDYQWIDKPHRHVRDLCGELDKAADALEAQASEIEALRNENAKLWGWLDTASQKGVATHGYMKGQR